MGTIPQPDARPEFEDIEQEGFDKEIPLLVKHDGPVTTIALPALVGTVTKEELTTVFQKILYKDMKRKRALLVSAGAFLISKTGNLGSGAPWPVNVPLEILSTAELWAAAATDVATLTVVTEVWAD